jgi:hypothetical protein
MQKFAGLRSSLVALAWAVPVAAAQAAEGYVRILAPADGAKLDGSADCASIYLAYAQARPTNV